MPQIVKKYNFTKLKELTKNLKYFYYQGEIMSFADSYEFFNLGFKISDTQKLNEDKKKLENFVNNVFLNEKDFNENLFFYIGHFNRKKDHDSILCITIQGKQNYGNLRDEQFQFVERFETMLEKYIQDNNLIPEIITNDPTNFEQITIERTWDPRHPDPNYMFLLKDAQ